MEIVLGVLIVLVSLPCWGGQAISWLAPSVAERWNLTETEASVDPVFYGDVRGEAMWDTFTLWTMPLAGILLVLGVDAWAYLGLVGGGMYAYFAGRGVATRREIIRRGGRAGDPDELRTAYGALVIWGVAGVLLIIGSAVSLAGS